MLQWIRHVVCFNRALEFVYTFLESVLGGEENLVVCANRAYEKTLKRYHGWIVRGIFNVSGITVIVSPVYSYLQLSILCTNHKYSSSFNMCSGIISRLNSFLCMYIYILYVYIIYIILYYIYILFVI